MSATARKAETLFETSTIAEIREASLSAHLHPLLRERFHGIIISSDLKRY